MPVLFLIIFLIIFTLCKYFYHNVVICFLCFCYFFQDCTISVLSCNWRSPLFLHMAQRFIFLSPCYFNSICYTVFALPLWLLYVTGRESQNSSRRYRWKLLNMLLTLCECTDSDNRPAHHSHQTIAANGDENGCWSVSYWWTSLWSIVWSIALLIIFI